MCFPQALNTWLIALPGSLFLVEVFTDHRTVKKWIVQE